MIRFKTSIKRFADKGEKTGWSYIEISEKLALKLSPGSRKSFRIKGQIDAFPIEKVAVLPMGNGDFILPINATIRKGIRKGVGDSVTLQFELDERELKLSADLIRCLKDEPAALAFFKSLPKGHQAYFSKWIEEAKTKPTKTKRLTMAVIALASGQGYSEMIRANKAKPV